MTTGYAALRLSLTKTSTIFSHVLHEPEAMPAQSMTCASLDVFD
jgi:hypothetical protein